MTGENGAPVPTALRGPDSIFGPFILDDTFRGLLTLTVPSTLAPVRLMLAEMSSPCKFDTRRKTVGYILRGLVDGSLPNRRTRRGPADGTAGSGRMTPPNNHTYDFTSHPFVVAGHRDQAPPVLERLAEERLRSDSLDARVERGQAQFLQRLIPPIRTSPQRICTSSRLPSCATTTGSVGPSRKAHWGPPPAGLGPR